METVVYRKGEGLPVPTGHAPRGIDGARGASGVPGAVWEPGAVQPALFYPLLSAQELDVWTHWLPTTTVYPCVSRTFLSDVASRLTQLNAPPEVLEEFQWVCTMALFDAYEIRTPQRRYARDPLLLGQRGTACYRIALWGESVRPFAEIAARVQKSLGIRQRAARRQTWAMVGGTLGGLCLGLWMGRQASFAGDRVVIDVVCALLGGFFTWVATQVQTPEQQQHDFLDRYRGEDRGRGDRSGARGGSHGPAAGRP